MKLIKESIKKIINGVGLILSRKPILFIIRSLNWFFNFLYSSWIKGQIKSAKSPFSVKYPLSLSNGGNVNIGQNFIAGHRLRIETITNFANKQFKPYLNIGDNVMFNDDCHIGCINSIIIGNNVLFASKVFITDHFHGDINRTDLNISPMQRELFSKGKVVIEDNVWIGEGVCIMPDVCIGKNTIIGANSVVTKSFPPNSVIAGNPAKLIKMGIANSTIM